MKVRGTAISGVLLIEPDFHADARGGFMEFYRADRYREAGIDCAFVQDNLSVSLRGVLRGLHLQHPNGQDKLVQAVVGEVFDVAVDLRFGSSTFGNWVGETLSEANRLQMFIPRGLAHGFCALSTRAVTLYKCASLYAPENELTLAWDDPTVAIAWPVADPILSDKDRRGLPLAEIARRLTP
jgi:dTDP-4-dehydrorhamnose 3,5-epimerase